MAAPSIDSQRTLPDRSGRSGDAWRPVWALAGSIAAVVVCGWIVVDAVRLLAATPTGNQDESVFAVMLAPLLVGMAAIPAILHVAYIAVRRRWLFIVALVATLPLASTIVALTI